MYIRTWRWQIHLVAGHHYHYFYRYYYYYYYYYYYCCCCYHHHYYYLEAGSMCTHDGSLHKVFYPTGGWRGWRGMPPLLQRTEEADGSR